MSVFISSRPPKFKSYVDFLYLGRNVVVNAQSMRMAAGQLDLYETEIKIPAPRSMSALFSPRWVARV